jgi:hypothetical protein
MTQIIPVVSDLQVPLHDERAVAAVATFLADRALPSVCVGDALDAWQISKWNRGMAGEFDGLLADCRDKTVEVLKSLQIRDMSRSNHDDRIETYVRNHAPGLTSLPELRIEKFLRLDSIGVRFHRQPYVVAPGWVLVHGDEGSLIQTPGGTAQGLAKKFGQSVVCGHTHKLGVQHHHFSYGGRISRELWGFEVGHLMDMEKASYLKAGSGNWQQGFGILIVDGGDVTPIPVPIRNGQFYFDGRVWKG